MAEIERTEEQEWVVPPTNVAAVILISQLTAVGELAAAGGDAIEH